MKSLLYTVPHSQTFYGAGRPLKPNAITYALNVVLKKKKNEQLIQFNTMHLLRQIAFFREKGDFHMQCAQLVSCLSRHTWCWCELFGKKWSLIEKSALCQTNIFLAKFLLVAPKLTRSTCSLSSCRSWRTSLKGHINVVWPPKMRLDPVLDQH